MTTLIPKVDLKNGGSTPAGAVNRTINEKLQDFISVKDFGATGDGATDDTQAFKDAIAYLGGNTLYRGGTLYVPKGVYKITDTLQIVSASGTDSSGINFFMLGDGPYSTTLDFSSSAAGKFGIQFLNGGNFGISKLFIKGATADGIRLGASPIDAAYNFEFVIDQVQVKDCVGSGLSSPQSYLATIRDCWFLNNGGHGIDLTGFHTSLDISRTECGGNAGDGFHVNGMVYSTFTACAADANTYAGFSFSNCNGVVLDGCGTESNKRDGFVFLTSDALVIGAPAAAQNIRGFVMNGCVGFFNSVDSVGTYATFIRAITQNSRPIDLTINGGSFSENVTGNVGNIWNAYSGDINLTVSNLYGFVTYAETESGIVNKNQFVLGYYQSDVDTTVTNATFNKVNYVSGNTFYQSFNQGGVARGSISYNGTNVVYATTSDYRLKENISPLVNGLDIISKLKPVSYVWKDSKKADEGFIAHELQAVIPQAVVGEKDAVDAKGNPLYQSIDTSFIVSRLVAATQELAKKVTDLEEQVIALGTK